MIMTLIGEQYIVGRLNILVVRLARVRVVLGSNEQAVASEAGLARLGSSIIGI